MSDLTRLNDHLHHQDLFRSFQDQLAKDFEQCNFPSGFVKSLQPDYALIHEAIVHELKRSEGMADTNIMQLLYRVDICEAQLKRYLQEQALKNHLETIAELIIKRVLQKVVIRRYYTRK